jgi:Surface-adhesin protein E
LSPAPGDHSPTGGGAPIRFKPFVALVVLLVFASSEAAADWTFLYAADDANWYVDLALGRKRGTMAKVWTLQQYGSAQPLHSNAYWSSKLQAEIRCHSRQWRVFYFSGYSGRMGEGEQLYSQQVAGAWKDVQAGTVSDALYQSGCNPGDNESQSNAN